MNGNDNFIVNLLLLYVKYSLTMNLTYRFVILCAFLHFAIISSAQYQNKLYKDNIQTLEVARTDGSLNYPIIYLGQDEQTISISFDLIEPDAHQITYSIIHCDADWFPSELFKDEYMEGFQNADVYDYEYSENTNIDYVNYKVELPNDDIQLKVSGNYTVVFFDEEDNDTLLTACFSIVESLVNIVGNVGGISTSGNSKSTQQVNFTVNHNGYSIDQPFTETKAIVIQNNHALPAVVNSKPTFIQHNQLIYDHNPVYTFPGGDEYHVFETTNLNYTGKGIESIDFFRPFYHINIYPNKLRQLEEYSFKNDINGRFVINSNEADEEYVDTQSDYVVVHFSVPMEMPLLYGKVYVGGDFTYNILDEKTEMTYNPKHKAYEQYFMLKQGYYNYRYFVVSESAGKIKSAPIELDAYQTENDYQIFFYHRQMGERYDHLIGYEVINSLK